MIKRFKDLQKKKGKKGFSMIELIIVIAIMAILVALIGTQLIPYLDKSREKKDLTTLDTCLTNFQAALAEAELSPADGTKYDGIDSGLKGADADGKVLAAYKEFAGEGYDTDGEINKAFKSDAAKGNDNVIFGVGPDDSGKVAAGVVYVRHGNLIASSSFSGDVSTGAVENP